MNSKKKAISPVVATALLLVVAIISIVGFQDWFSSFSSSNIGVETLVGEKLYVKAGENLSISKLIIDGNECLNAPGTYSNIGTINVSDCLVNVSSKSPEVLILTDEGIITEYVFFKNPTSSSSLNGLDCSGLVGGDWITVPGNPTFGTSDFCVMKYEAKNVANIAT